MMTVHMQQIKKKFEIQKKDFQTQYQSDQNDKENHLNLEELQSEFQRILHEKMDEIEVANEGWEREKNQLEETQTQYRRVCDKVA